MSGKKAIKVISLAGVPIEMSKNISANIDGNNNKSENTKEKFIGANTLEDTPKYFTAANLSEYEVADARKKTYIFKNSDATKIVIYSNQTSTVHKKYNILLNELPVYYNQVLVLNLPIDDNSLVSKSMGISFKDENKMELVSLKISL